MAFIEAAICAGYVWISTLTSVKIRHYLHTAQQQFGSQSYTILFYYNIIYLKNRGHLLYSVSPIFAVNRKSKSDGKLTVKLVS